MDLMKLLRDLQLLKVDYNLIYGITNPSMDMTGMDLKNKLKNTE